MAIILEGILSMIEVALFLICLPFAWDQCDWDYGFYINPQNDTASIGVYYESKHLRFSPNYHEYNERAIGLTNKTVWANAMDLIQDRKGNGFNNCHDPCIVTNNRMSFKYWQDDYISAQQEFSYKDDR